ncbi:MAG: hypothetical protein N0C81_06840 [Candidatus Thiodiazotropha lotti]|uniref:Uncharacterized protein n=1 Tax=Candidatus Thiodiazotropha lotti TaxID=2792787 RepID=A0A9E4K437_9GAMM|nr:hypothetical protein [Candidatus Thiodiazotropha lotti]ODC02045.1 hypothetical protein A3197_21125 [Candidatus Thiodiazotropha endoloripes]MCG7920424.1 hypothetical protein [Candidatus Thiodiazotropha lotti]MCG7931334.1 hypothetical protein [Candidatus Thiodiazotropha lotti]MCG7938679.1 hypothetical protein [Candidatus Thiodiazotropha lotti]
MPEYTLKFSEDPVEESRLRTMDEINQFIRMMDGKPLAVVTLDDMQSDLWDTEGDVDYQDQYGEQIISQISDDDTETLLIRNSNGLPLALGVKNHTHGWQGLGIEKRLRFEVARMFQSDETEFD